MRNNRNITTEIEETKRLQELFCKHAFLFLRNAETILADPRMANCVVPFRNGTAQTGLFPCHTLGTCLEWWQTSEYATHFTDDGRRALTYKFTGSLLSGVNTCYRVYEDGTTERFSNKELVNMCRSFLPICKRYYDKKEDVVPCSLDEVIEHQAFRSRSISL